MRGQIGEQRVHLRHHLHLVHGLVVGEPHHPAPGGQPTAAGPGPPKVKPSGTSAGQWLIAALRYAFWAYTICATLLAVFYYHVLFTVKKLVITNVLPGWVLPIFLRCPRRLRLQSHPAPADRCPVNRSACAPRPLLRPAPPAPRAPPHAPPFHGAHRRSFFFPRAYRRDVIAITPLLFPVPNFVCASHAWYKRTSPM